MRWTRQGDVTRIRGGWHIDGAELRTTVRDDGPGTLVEESLGAHRLAERVTALGGTLTLDAVRSWGTTVTVDLPLSALTAPAEDPLTVLNLRELEVLGQLTSGRRNRQIAEHLHISERTVKFHVSNILNKLEVGSRGEAAAMARGA